LPISSGQAAITLAMLTFLAAGDRVLIADTAYPPVRDFAGKDLAKLGIEAVFYDPTSVAEVERLLDARTRLVWMESPGSTTMEVQDLPAIAAAAHRAGAIVGCDNTWASPLNFKPLAHGADIVVEALTKFFSGHSDVLMGSITLADADHARAVRATLGRYGIGVSPDDCSLVLRGMETMPVRLAHASRVAADLVERFAADPAVAQVLYPPRPDSPGHALWRRDFTGASSVFSVVFQPQAVPHVAGALDTLETFAIGASWGGTRSLMAPMPVRRFRTARPWAGDDLVLRVSIGLEDPADLAADIDRFLNHLGAGLDATSRATGTI